DELETEPNGGAVATATGGMKVNDPGDQVCNPPHLTVTKTPDGGTYRLGEKASFTIVVASDGQATAQNVVLTDTLPTLGNLTSWAITTPPALGTCTLTAPVSLSCTFGDLAPGQTRTVVVSTTVVADTTACQGVVLRNG